jgi:hypothetical protein
VIDVTKVVVNSAAEVVIDGQPVGNISDAFLNYRDAAGALYDGLIAYETTLRQATAAAVADLSAAHQVELDARDQTIKNQADAATAAQVDFDAKIESLTRVSNEMLAAVNQKNQDNVDQCQKILDQQAAAANAAITKLSADLAASQKLSDFNGRAANLAMSLVQHLKDNDPKDAAAAAQEINRMQLTADSERLATEKTRVDAALAALPAA